MEQNQNNNNALPADFCKLIGTEYSIESDIFPEDQENFSTKSQIKIVEKKQKTGKKLDKKSNKRNADLLECNNETIILDFLN